MTGLFLAALAVDVHLSDTYFVVAHFHYIMVGGTLLAYLGGLHYWWPKITGRMYPGRLGKIFGPGRLRRIQPDVPAAVCCLAIMGMPRRYHVYPAGVSGVACAFHRRCFDSGRRVIDPADLPHLVHALRQDGAEANPWHLPGLEWRTQSPPPTENFDYHSGGHLGSLRVCSSRRDAKLSVSFSGHWRVGRKGREGLSLWRPIGCDGRRETLAESYAESTKQAIPRCSTTLRIWSSSARPELSACGCSWSPKSCSSAGCFSPTRSIALSIPEAFAICQQSPRHKTRRDQHGRADPQQLYDGHGRLQHAGRQASRRRLFAWC